MLKRFICSFLLITLSGFAFAQQPTNTTTPNYKGESE